MANCAECGKKLVLDEGFFSRDPYYEEIDDDDSDETNPERWWCDSCYQLACDEI